MATDADKDLAEHQNLGQTYVSKLFAPVAPGAVFGAPVVSGEYAIITASEVGASGGFGSGWGRGNRPAPSSSIGTTPAGSGGGGGGGGSHARPVAAIVIGPNGVTVRPIVDVTKLALTGLAAVGAVAAAYLRLRVKAR